MINDVYLLMLEYPNGDIQLAKKNPRGKLVVAREENIDLLEDIGKKLLAENLIIGYQLLKSVNAPVRNYELVEITTH